MNFYFFLLVLVILPIQGQVQVVRDFVLFTVVAPVPRTDLGAWSATSICFYVGPLLKYQPWTHILLEPLGMVIRVSPSFLNCLVGLIVFVQPTHAFSASGHEVLHSARGPDQERQQNPCLTEPPSSRGALGMKHVTCISV